jgi:hypothetical protein
VDSTAETLEKGKKLRNGDDYDSKKDKEEMFPKKTGSALVDSASESEDED